MIVDERRQISFSLLSVHRYHRPVHYIRLPQVIRLLRLKLAPVLGRQCWLVHKPPCREKPVQGGMGELCPGQDDLPFSGGPKKHGKGDVRHLFSERDDPGGGIVVHGSTSAFVLALSRIQRFKPVP